VVLLNLLVHAGQFLCCQFVHRCNVRADGFHCGHFDSSVTQTGPMVQSEVDNIAVVVPLVERSAVLSPVG